MELRLFARHLYFRMEGLIAAERQWAADEVWAMSAKARHQADAIYGILRTMGYGHHKYIEGCEVGVKAMRAQLFPEAMTRRKPRRKVRPRRKAKKK